MLRDLVELSKLAARIHLPALSTGVRELSDCRLLQTTKIVEVTECYWFSTCIVIKVTALQILILHTTLSGPLAVIQRKFPEPQVVS